MRLGAVLQWQTRDRRGAPRAHEKLDAGGASRAHFPTMIIKPKIRGFICVTAHPAGCAAHVQEQIDYTRARGPIGNAPKRVLVVGASTGYGLASRIVPAFAGGAATLGVFFEKPPEGGKPASAGWYNSAAFEEKARAAGLYAKSINGDAFSDAIKQQAIDSSRPTSARLICLFTVWHHPGVSIPAPGWCRAPPSSRWATPSGPGPWTPTRGSSAM